MHLNLMFKRNAQISVLIVYLCAQAATAKDYVVEAVIFQNTQAAPAMQSQHSPLPRQFDSEAAIWPLPPALLSNAASAINRSPDYVLLHHYAWGQESLPSSLSPAMNITQSDLNGSIKVYASRRLFANLDLDFNGYRLIEKRRLKLNEQHFFDHPKFGVLLQVSRLEADQEKAEEP